MAGAAATQRGGAITAQHDLRDAGPAAAATTVDRMAGPEVLIWSDYI
jgi:hypothetical protein